MLRRFFRRIKYRWVHCYDALPGELEPIKWGDRRIRALRIFPPGEDVEKYRILRRLRAVLLGYGPPWTFREALWDWALPGLGVGLGLIVCAVCVIALSIIPQIVRYWVHSWGCWGG